MPCGSSPCVSIVIPTYNAADYLGQAIQSALDQTFESFELLVLDNASEDNTPEIVKQFNDQRLIYHRNERNLGFAGNANLGRELARGEFIAYLGADDIWPEHFLQTAVEFLQKEPSVSFVHGAAAWIDADSVPYGGTDNRWARITPGKQAFLDTFRYGFCFSTMLMRTAMVKELSSLDEAWQELTDSWLFLKLCLQGDIGYLQHPEVLYRVHRESISLNMYRDGRLFRNHFKHAKEAFAWPASRAAGLAKIRRKALRSIAIQSIQILHLIRLEETRLIFLRILGQILSEVPEVALLPSTWMRLALGLSPRTLLKTLRSMRHRNWQREHQGDLNKTDSAGGCS